MAGRGARLLEPSVTYAVGVVLAVTPELLSRPTPCRGWDLRMLLRHACESLAAIGEGIGTGRVGRDPAAEDDDLVADPARAFRDRAGHCWTPGPAPATSARSSRSPTARWRPAS